jgi:hypothetical protein
MDSDIITTSIQLSNIFCWTQIILITQFCVEESVHNTVCYSISKYTQFVRSF